MLSTSKAEAARLALMAVQYREQVGQAIRDRRDQLGVSQEAVADRIDAWFADQGKPRRTPMTAQTISRWERGENMGRADNLEALAAALETTVGEIMAQVKAKPLADKRRNGGDPTSAQLDRIEAKLNAVLEALGRSPLVADPEMAEIAAELGSAIDEGPDPEGTGGANDRPGSATGG